MKNQNWTFRTLPVEIADTARWCRVDVEALDADEQVRFNRYKTAIEAYIASGKINAICKEMGIHRSDLVRQLNRCVSVAADGQLMGWRALLRGHRTRIYERTLDLPTGRTQSSGAYTGAFTAFLEKYPEIRRKIDGLILKRKGQLHEARISVKTLHKTFVGLCEEAGIAATQYPFNVKSRARRSLARYVHDVLDLYPEQAAASRYGKEARSHMNVGAGYSVSPLSFAPYDLVGLDPHKMDCYGTVRIKGPSGYRRFPIERLWIVPILEYHCRAVIGYSVGIRTECSAATIEEAVISAMTQWRPRELKVPGMAYAPGAGLPSGIFPEMVGRGWVTLMVDNAAVHFSNTIAQRARRRIGCFLNYGPVGHWEHRSALERLMKTLELYGFQRLPSSTGSSPKDSKRDDPVRKAVEHGIDWEELLDLVDVVIANYNVTPNEAIGNLSPLSVLRDYVHNETLEFLPRRLPPATGDQPELGIKVETRIIRGDPSQGRRPYIEIDRVHYTNPILARAMGLIGRKIRVHIMERNMCTVTAYHENGEELGILMAQGAWGHTPHTREMRKQINALRDSGQLIIGPNDDPINKLLEFRATDEYKKAEKAQLKVSRNATKLAGAAMVSGLPIPDVSDSREAALAAQSNQTSSRKSQSAQKTTLSRLVNSPQWKTIIR